MLARLFLFAASLAILAFYSHAQPFDNNGVPLDCSTCTLDQTTTYGLSLSAGCNISPPGIDTAYSVVWNVGIDAYKYTSGQCAGAYKAYGISPTSSRSVQYNGGLSLVSFVDGPTTMSYYNDNLILVADGSNNVKVALSSTPLVDTSGILFQLTESMLPYPSCSVAIDQFLIAFSPYALPDNNTWSIPRNVVTDGARTYFEAYQPLPINEPSQYCCFNQQFTITSPVVVGDPQFVGLRGQSYQVHGIDHQVYNLVSSANTQVNARFDFLSSGVCPKINGTTLNENCWSHPGSYLGAVGVQQRVSSGEMHTLIINSGTGDQGFDSIVLDDKTMTVGDSFTDDVFSVSLKSSHVVEIDTEEFVFTFSNSDKFLNQAVRPRKPLSQITAHGLFGQTAEGKIYKSALKYIAGKVDDYALSENTLVGTDFAYNRFTASS